MVFIINIIEKNSTNSPSFTLVGTHNGIFHADDVTAAAILKMINPSVKFIRSRKEDLLNTCDIVFDVGNGQYDHHTNEKEFRENGIPYAAAGLIWRDFGHFLTTPDILELIDKTIIQGIDAVDNGHHIEKHFSITDIPSIVDDFNPSWDDNTNEDELFLLAVDFVITILENAIRRATAKNKSKSYIDEVISNREQPELLILEQFCPWQEAIITREDTQDVLFVIFPDKHHGFRIQTVPQSLGSFKSRKDLPTFWGGLEEKDLDAIIGINDSIFCHPNLFIAGASSKESILKMASLALNN